MPRIRVYPYKQGSRSAKALASALNGKVLKKVGSGFLRQPSDMIINWGDGTCPLTPCLNNPQAIQLASNKKQAFEKMKDAGVQVPAFASSSQGVSWTTPTVVRHKLTGHSGEGIEICDAPASSLPPAPLYVEYIKKKDEYRIHVGRGGAIIAVQRKARRHDAEVVNWQVRNHHNGFVFVRSNVNPPQACLDEARKALEAIGLDFGAVDVIWNDERKKAYVLEINTAPGLEGQTITDYANFFEGLV